MWSRSAASRGMNQWPTPYWPGGGSSMPCLAISSRKNRSGICDEHAGAVADQRVGPDRAAMRQVLEHEEAVLDDLVRLDALHLGDEADAAGIVLVARIVEAAADSVRRGGFD